MKSIPIYPICLILFVTACSKYSGSQAQTAVDCKERISVHFSGLTACAQSKGAEPADEDSVANLNVWCYLDGKLDAFSYNDVGGCSVRLYEGTEYSVYAIANTGRLTPPYLESDALAYRCDIRDFSINSLRKALPMSTVSPLSINTGAVSGIVPLELSRMMARYNLKISRTAGSASRLEVSGVRIGNSPSHCLVFGENSAGGDAGDGDSINGDVSGAGVSLYLVENIQGTSLDEKACTFIEVSGRLVYEDRPSDASVYVLDQDMTYRWYLKDRSSGTFSIRRNTEYSGVLSWSDFGWISDPDHVNVDKINEEATHCIVFCDKDGTPVSGGIYDNLDASSTIDLHYRLYPASDSSCVTISTNVPPQSIHLSFTGAPVHIGDGIFRQRIANNISREMPAEMVVTLTNASRGISCSAKLKFSGKGSCAEDWAGEEDETVNY